MVFSLSVQSASVHCVFYYSTDIDTSARVFYNKRFLERIAFLQGGGSMDSALNDFTLAVPDAGYRWANLGVSSSAGQPERVLVEEGEPGLGRRRRYAPFVEAPALFREFAALRPTEADILTFANRWGRLGEGPLVTGDTPLAGHPAELFLAWLRSISEMRQAVWLWNRLTSKTPEEQRQLHHHVKWAKDEDGITSVVFDSHPHLSPRQAMGDDGFLRVAKPIASDHRGRDGLAQYELGDVSQPARTFLASLVNAALDRRVSAQVFGDDRSERMESEGKLPVMFSLQLVPSCLYAALWLQLARVMTADKRQRQCPGCDRWFEVQVRPGPNERAVRADKQYCRPACRLRAYRKKRDEAIRLHADGKKVKEIAQALETGVGLVKKWVAKKKG